MAAYRTELPAQGDGLSDRTKARRQAAPDRAGARLRFAARLAGDRARRVGVAGDCGRRAGGPGADAWHAGRALAVLRRSDAYRNALLRLCPGGGVVRLTSGWWRQETPETIRQNLVAGLLGTALALP